MYGPKLECKCKYVCVFSSHLFWTSSSLDVPAGVTQEEGYTGFLIHLPSAVRALIFLSFGRSLCRYSPFHAVKKWHCMFRSGRVDVLVFFGRSGPPPKEVQ